MLIFNPLATIGENVTAKFSIIIYQLNFHHVKILSMIGYTYISSCEPHPELFCLIVLFEMAANGSTVVLHSSATRPPSGPLSSQQTSAAIEEDKTKTHQT